MLAFRVKHGISEESIVICSDNKSKRFLSIGFPSKRATQDARERMMHEAYNKPHLLEQKIPFLHIPSLLKILWPQPKIFHLERRENYS